MTKLAASAWPKADLASVGMPAATVSLAELSTGDLAEAVHAIKNGHCYLDWRLFQFALSMFDHVQAVSKNVAVTQRSILDLEAQTALELQMSLDSTDHFARSLLDDAVCARDRLPAVFSTMRLGLIDRARFHRIVSETQLVRDDETMALIDQTLALQIMGLRGGVSSMSITKTGHMARKLVAEYDPDAEKLDRDRAKASRNVGFQALDSGMAQISITATAEDVRLVRQMLDAVIAGLCPADPRTKAQARSDAAIALLQRIPFTCHCESDGCTAQISDVQLDTRAARIVVHVLCDATTLDGGDQCGYLDGYGPVSGDHVRQIVERDDSVIHQHDLGDLLEPDSAADPIGDDDLDEAAVHRKGPRPDSPDECRADGARPDPKIDKSGTVASESDDETSPPPRFLIANTALPSDPYRPSLLTDLVARFLWGTCSIPGCERAAFACDLDHVAEFDNICPSQGGPTCVCNLLPKCRFHHLMKTHLTGFLDELWIDENGRYHSSVTTPGGITVELLAPNQWLFPQLADLRCRHQLAQQAATGTATSSLADGPQRSRTRAAAKHARRRAQRTANYEERAAERTRQVAAEEAATWAEYDAARELGEPPF
ncbi:HNH endonuclease [Gordonia alkaliphila]|uniref:HNH endonuclease signature motif containing protein n=1 Tax=Gordonia alkaliphila TaxID=1053547 RepID=UPI001FF3B36D|nr:HNH endonuclease signature motif containing protein [Gordonia alkaliphila]MCK0440467.1 HNH endonuclease [Gordonia alkaliphila]